MLKSKPNHIYWFTGFIVYLIAGAIILLTHTKGEFELTVNQYHTEVADYFFAYYTWVGDGLVYVVIAIIIFFMYSRRAGVLALVCYAITGLTAQILKKTIFQGYPRPKAFFDDSVVLHFVQGVEIHNSNSFPSGHSVSVFSLFCLLSLYFKQPFWSVIFLFLAILGSFSRVYLLQHFLVDTYFGAIIGTVLTLILYYAFTKRYPILPKTS
jgi:membrane-associated phospholipid phosphatase